MFPLPHFAIAVHTHLEIIILLLFCEIAWKIYLWEKE